MSDQMSDEEHHNDIFGDPHLDELPYEEIMERLAAKLRASDEEYQRLDAQKEEQEETLYNNIVEEYIKLRGKPQKWLILDTVAIANVYTPYGRKSKNKTRKILRAIVGKSPEEIAQLRLLEDSPEFRAIYRFLTRDRSLDPNLPIRPAPERQPQQPQSTGRRQIQI